MLAEYSKGVENLTVLGMGPAVSGETILTATRREMLSTRYSEEETMQFGDLSKPSTEQFVELLHRTAMGLNRGQKVTASGEFVSLVRPKESAKRHLHPTSTAREVILAEKDVLPMYEAIAKFEVFDRLLMQELGR